MMSRDLTPRLPEGAPTPESAEIEQRISEIRARLAAWKGVRAKVTGYEEPPDDYTYAELLMDAHAAHDIEFLLDLRAASQRVSGLSEQEALALAMEFGLAAIQMRTSTMPNEARYNAAKAALLSALTGSPRPQTETEK